MKKGSGDARATSSGHNSGGYDVHSCTTCFLGYKEVDVLSVYTSANRIPRQSPGYIEVNTFFKYVYVKLEVR